MKIKIKIFNQDGIQIYSQIKLSANLVIMKIRF